jgi:hypothetical protein
LFVLFGSTVGELALAVFVSVPLAGAVTVTVTLLTWPLAKVPNVQLTTPLAFNPPPVALTNVTPNGNVSVTTMLLALDGPKFVTDIVYTRLLAAKTEAEPVLPKPTSAAGVTVVMTGAVTLFVEFGSTVGELALAVLVSVPLAGAVTVTVTLLTWPPAKMPNVQLTTPLVFIPLPLADTKVTVAGNVSVTTTPLALDGPKFVTDIVYTRLLVAGTVAEPVLPRPTSAAAVTVVMTGTVTLFVLLGSTVGELALAVFVSEPPAGAVTVTVILLIWPPAKVPNVQLTTPLVFNPPPVALTNVTPNGNVSVTTTLLALDGPKFVTEIVYTRLLVAGTVAEPVLPRPTSAAGVTVVMTGTVTLFVLLGSTVGELALAVFVSVPLAGAVTVTVTLLTWPLVKVPNVQLTTPLVFTPPPVALTNVTPNGNVSVTTTPLALDGPKFVTDIV